MNRLFGRSLWAAIAAALLVALGASEATAQQGGYVFLRCTFTEVGQNRDEIYRIGNGTWNYFFEGAGVVDAVHACGSSQSGAYGARSTIACQFTDSSFVKTITTRGSGPETSTDVWTINRYTGQYTRVSSTDGRVFSSSTGQGRSIPEPAMPARQF